MAAVAVNPAQYGFQWLLESLITHAASQSSLLPYLVKAGTAIGTNLFRDYRHNLPYRSRAESKKASQQFWDRQGLAEIEIEKSQTFFGCTLGAKM
jgi:hypothetical protein